MKTFDRQMRRDFIQEVAFLLEEAQKHLGELRSSASTSKTINQIQRIAHNIVLAATAMNSQALKCLGEKFEDTLNLLKTGDLRVDKDILNLLSELVWILFKIVNKLNCSPSTDFDLEGLVEQIDFILAKKCAKKQKVCGTNAALLKTYCRVVDSNSRSNDLTSGNRWSLNFKEESSDHKNCQMALDEVEELRSTVEQLTIDYLALSSDSEIKHREKFEAMSSTLRSLQKKSFELGQGPVKEFLNRISHHAKGIAQKNGLQIEVNLIGGDVQVSEQQLVYLEKPLLQLVQNAVEHAFVENRCQPKLNLEIAYEREDLVVSVLDNGQGPNFAQIRKKAIRKGILNSDQEYNEAALLELMFHPSFSTKSRKNAQVTYGLGLPTIRKQIRDLGGDITVNVNRKEGCVFKVSLPSLKNIFEGYVVELGEHRFVLPARYVEEKGDTQVQDLKIISLARLLNIHMAKPEEALHRVVNLFGKRFVLSVESIGPKQDIVGRELGREFKNLKSYTSGTILNDGRAALVLDLPQIFRAMEYSGEWYA